VPDTNQYLDWHTGVEFDRDTRTWRGFIRQLDGGERRYTQQTYADQEDAAVDASELPSAARRGILEPTS
jgi:hypothetical protein